jgi:hypothetical protein
MAWETSVTTSVPGRNGGRLLAGGVAGHKGAGGRKPDQVKAWCAKLVTDKRAREAIQSILFDRDHPRCLDAFRYLRDVAFGKPTETIDLNANVDATISREPMKILLPPLDPVGPSRN